MILKSSYIVEPFSAGDKKQSVVMTLPSSVVKVLKFDPLTMFFLLKVRSPDNLELNVIRQKDLIKESEQNPIPVEQFVNAEQQVSITRGDI